MYGEEAVEAENSDHRDEIPIESVLSTPGRIDRVS